MVQWVKDPVWSLLWPGFDSWPGNKPKNKQTNPSSDERLHMCPMLAGFLGVLMPQSPLCDSGGCQIRGDHTCFSVCWERGDWWYEGSDLLFELRSRVG